MTNNLKQLQLTDCNSGESDFEVIDSELDQNEYRRLNNENINKTNINNQPEQQDDDSDDYLLTNNFINLEKYIPHYNNSSDKINLSLSQEPILLLEQKPPQPQQHKNDNINLIENDYNNSLINKNLINNGGCLKKSRSINFSNNTFKIVPVDITNIKKSNENDPINNDIQINTKSLTIFPSSTESFHHKNQNNLLFDHLIERNVTSVTTFSGIYKGIQYNEENSSLEDVIKPLNLEKPTSYQIPVDVNHSSSTNSIFGRDLDKFMLHHGSEPISNDFKCQLCEQLFKDPRTLNCLHSFCFQCLLNDNFGKDASIPYWPRPEEDNIEWSNMVHFKIPNDSGSPTPTRPNSRSSTNSFRNKKTSAERQSKDKTNKTNTKEIQETTTTQNVEKPRILVCSICQSCTALPIGGVELLPKNLILVRKIENILMKMGDEVISNIWCSLCCVEIPATYHCLSCTKNLCGFCKEAHDRQKSTTDHIVKNIIDLRKTRNMEKNLTDQSKLTSKCFVHPGFELKHFCITCQQVICSDCTIHIHKNHKYENLQKAYKIYHKMLKDSTEKTKPLCEYATYSISKLSGISKRILEKCDQIQNEVEIYMAAYFEAIEVHRKTLFQQIEKVRESKMQMMLEEQLDLEKKSSQAKNAVEFSEELLNIGNEIEILSFVNILLKRLEYCQIFNKPLDPKISDTLHFLPEIRAPSTKAQNNIPLYGIITTQTVEPKFCTLETEGYTQLRVHCKAELVILSRDTDGVPLCHGGLTIKALIKYKAVSSKIVSIQINDKRDGTYSIVFIPDLAGIMTLAVTINNKHIKGSPFTLIARTLRPHKGIFHCCTFCSSKGSKTVMCACECVMPGFKGCGHGHSGHPGRRHWSCCASVLENSECTTANRF